jgi:hypothetical protein
MTSPRVFISHASKDENTATAICDALESRGIQCWIAARDIVPGENFQEAIVAAIKASSLMVLVFSENTNESDEIKKEIVLAGRNHVTIIPVRVEDVSPRGALEYELLTRQWINLFLDWKREIERLTRQIETALKRTVAATADHASVSDRDAGQLTGLSQAKQIAGDRNPGDKMQFAASAEAMAKPRSVPTKPAQFHVPWVLLGGGTIVAGLTVALWISGVILPRAVPTQHSATAAGSASPTSASVSAPASTQSGDHSVVVGSRVPAEQPRAGTFSDPVVEPADRADNADRPWGECLSGDTPTKFRPSLPEATKEASTQAQRDVSTFYTQIIACGISEDEVQKLGNILQMQGLIHRQTPIITNYRQSWMSQTSNVHYYDRANAALAQTLANKINNAVGDGTFGTTLSPGASFPPRSKSHTMIIDAIGPSCASDPDHKYDADQAVRWTEQNFLPMRKNTYAVVSGNCDTREAAARYTDWLRSKFNADRSYQIARVVFDSHDAFTVMMAAGLTSSRADEMLRLFDVEEISANKARMTDDVFCAPGRLRSGPC